MSERGAAGLRRLEDGVFLNLIAFSDSRVVVRLDVKVKIGMTFKGGLEHADRLPGQRRPAAQVERLVERKPLCVADVGLVGGVEDLVHTGGL